MRHPQDSVLRPRISRMTTRWRLWPSQRTLTPLFWTAMLMSLGSGHFCSAFISYRISLRNGFHGTTHSHLGLNRFLFDPTELDTPNDDDDDTQQRSTRIPTVTVPEDDYRAIHAAKILGLHSGDTVRAGIVLEEGNDRHAYAGLMTDTATVTWIPQGNDKKAEHLGNGDPPGSLQLVLHNLTSPAAIPPTPPVSVILALPRPLQLNRLLSVMAQLGVDHVVLTAAYKVPRAYFGSHLFRHPARLRERLIEGLCQAGVDVRLPRITVVRRFSRFLHDDLDRYFPRDVYARVVAHPERSPGSGGGDGSAHGEDGTTTTTTIPTHLDAHAIQFPDSKQQPRRIVVAIGPEGGWEEPNELNLLTRDCRFQHVTMGPRVLRTDVAVVSLLALAHQACRPMGHESPPSSSSSSSSSTSIT